MQTGQMFVASRTSPKNAVTLGFLHFSVFEIFAYNTWIDNVKVRMHIMFRELYWHKYE